MNVPEATQTVATDYIGQEAISKDAWRTYERAEWLEMIFENNIE